MSSNLRVDNIQPTTGSGIGIGTASGSVTFNADVTGGMNITTGSLGVGTNNPTEKLDINGGLKVYANTNIATFKNNQLRSDAAGTYYFDHGTTGQSFTFRTSTSSSLDTTGPSVTSAGNISFPSGKGIDFSATADASGMTSELLDDYEEGSWTPTIRLDGGTAAGTTLTPHDSIYKGRYVKIGDMVFVEAYVRYNFSTLSGTWTGTAIQGLPYTQGNQSSQQYAAVHIGYLSNFYSGFPTTNNNFPAGYVRSGQSDLMLTINNPNGAETTISNSVLSSSSSGGIMFSAYYRDSASG